MSSVSWMFALDFAFDMLGLCKCVGKISMFTLMGLNILIFIYTAETCKSIMMCAFFLRIN